MKSIKEIISATEPTLVAFVHEGKEEADEVKTVIDRVREQYAGKVNVVYFPNHFNNRISEDFRINAYPCYILFKEGQELMRESGRKTETELSELVERAL